VRGPEQHPDTATSSPRGARAAGERPQPPRCAQPRLLTPNRTDFARIAEDALGHALRDALGDVLGNALGDVLGNALGDVLNNALGDVLNNALGDVLGDALGAALGDVLNNALGDVLGDVLDNALGDVLDNALGDVLDNALGDVLDNALGAALGAAPGDAEGANPYASPPNMLVTEPSSKTSWIARANSGAIGSTVNRSNRRSGGSGTVSVTTTSSIAAS
jgi:outer membrane lipoprotein SlyB